eukprot:3519748-Prorocentrum_lima.AAC.1
MQAPAVFYNQRLLPPSSPGEVRLTLGTPDRVMKLEKDKVKAEPGHRGKRAAAGGTGPKDSTSKTLRQKPPVVRGPLTKAPP